MTASNYDEVTSSTKGAQLAQTHWKWIDGLLEKMPLYVPGMGAQTVRIVRDMVWLMELLRYVYLTAFEHGYQHGKEQGDDA